MKRLWAPAQTSHAGARPFGHKGVRRLTLTDFRSYAALDLRVHARLIVLTGENGAGKTNLLEALSLLAPGRGLRRAELARMSRERAAMAASRSRPNSKRNGRRPAWDGHRAADGCASATQIPDRSRARPIHTRLFRSRPGGMADTRDGRAASLDRRETAGDSSTVWCSRSMRITPPASTRLNVPCAAATVSWKKDQAPTVAGSTRSRKKPLELAIAIAAARIETVSRLRLLIWETRDKDSPFPWAELAVRGDVETLVEERPALEAEDIYRGILQGNRSRDAAARRTLIGPQASDLCVQHGPKQAPAAQTSTGEQKALLTGLVLAHVRLVSAMSGLAPLVLLDEIAAHFDPIRRDALFEVLGDLGRPNLALWRRSGQCSPRWKTAP